MDLFRVLKTTGLSAFKIVSLGLVIVATFLLQQTIAPTEHVNALASQLGVDQVTLNPGGGIQTNGSDGLRFTINAAGGGSSYDSAQNGQDGVVYRATRQYCCGAGAPMLNIGGTLYGQSGPANSSSSWSSIAIISTSGATSVGTRTSATGNSAATVRYTVVHGGLTYTIDRTVTYTYPNDYVTDSYSFTIPVGNAANVKFYLGGDTAPGSSDSGYGVMLTTPVRTVISLNTFSQIMFGFREVSGSKIFDGATSQQFSAPYATVQAGNDIGYVVTASNHDAGLMVQWNLGSTPGTQTATLQQFATQQGTNLNANLSATKVEVSEATTLNISVENTVLSAANGLAYTLTLPSGLVIGNDAPTNSCGGTLTANQGSSTITLSGASVASAANCVISLPILSEDPDVYTINSASISGLSGLTNNVGTFSLTVTDDNDSDGITNAIEAAAPNTGDANNDGTPDKNQLHVTSFVNSVTNEYSSIIVDDACELNSSTISAEASLASQDSQFTYPLGIASFTADCGTPGFTTQVEQRYYGDISEDFVLRKYNSNTNEYTTIDATSITGSDPIIVTYEVTDGGALDEDGLENGVIVDPVGLAVLSTTAGTNSATSVEQLATTGISIPVALYTALLLLLGSTIFYVAAYKNISKSN